MKFIPLTKGRFAMVDDEDFEKVNQFRWRLLKNGRNEYAQAWIKSNNPKRLVYLHQFIMGFPGGFIDHKDGDGLNNQKFNLRTCSNSQNNANAKKRIDNTSGFKGVSFHKNRGRWCAKINNTHIGIFDSPIEAAIAYDTTALKVFGEFALTNQKLGLLCH